MTWITLPATTAALRQRRSPQRTLARVAAIPAASLAFGLQAQTATIYGSVGNLDVVNNTGEDACGFEIALEGVTYDPNIYSYSFTRCGRATLSPYTVGAVSGTRVTWKSSDCATSRTSVRPSSSISATRSSA